MPSPLKQKIEKKQAKIGVVGLGYVGLPLAVEFAREGFEVTGFDVSEGRNRNVNAHKSYVEDISDDDLKSTKGKLRATSDFGLLKDMDIVSVCVPTPLGKTHDPDISYVLAVRDEIKKRLHPDMLVILESTTYPGTTEELFLPMIEEAGYKIGENFFLTFSPERIDPGNRKYQLRNTPKVIGGMTPACTEMLALAYGFIVDKLVPVSSPSVAELVKLLENTYRAVNIGLVNEMAIMCRILGVSVWEVIDAAASKPFGFTPFYPGPGLGGHCIPIDPHYLSWKLKSLNYTARFINLAAEVNTGMPRQVVRLVADRLNQVEKSVKGSNILILGMAYKPNISDMRESPSFDVFELLHQQGANVQYNDPFAPELTVGGKKYRSVDLTPANLEKQDLIVITSNHSQYDMREILPYARAVVDTRNATKGISDPKITRL